PHILSFFNHLSPTECYTLSLHDALPIFSRLISQGIESSQSFSSELLNDPWSATDSWRINNVLQRTISLIKNDEIHTVQLMRKGVDRKSTRLNSSHVSISYAVFCLKKKIR